VHVGLGKDKPLIAEIYLFWPVDWLNPFKGLESELELARKYNIMDIPCSYTFGEPSHSRKAEMLYGP